jgi:formylglycine-generating enzyme required for sulfatase activity
VLPIAPSRGRLSNNPIMHLSRNTAVAYTHWAGSRFSIEVEWQYVDRGSIQSQGHTSARTAWRIVKAYGSGYKMVDGPKRFKSEEETKAPIKVIPIGEK